MSSGGQKTGNEYVMTLSKRPCVEDRLVPFQKGDISGLYVQTFEKFKPWNLGSRPWMHVDSHCFDVPLNEEHVIGVNIVPSNDEYFTALPYGPKGMKCVNREGCGGIVQRGQQLRWKCGSLLRVEFGAVSVDVMVVRLDVKQDDPGCLHIESMVRDMFHVDCRSYATTEPCWLVGSVQENERDRWKYIAEDHERQLVELKAEAHKMQLQRQTDQRDLKTYFHMHTTISLIATCSVCKNLHSEEDPCFLAPCGHFLCEECHKDFFKAIGNSIPRCSECGRQVPPKERWLAFWVLTGVVAALKKAITIEDVG